MAKVNPPPPPPPPPTPQMVTDGIGKLLNDLYVLKAEVDELKEKVKFLIGDAEKT